MASKSFVIDRTKWLHGNDDGLLLSEEGKMCCLGFYTKSCGVKNEHILNVGVPSKLNDNDLMKLPSWLRKFGSKNVAELVSFNDDSEMPEKEREKSISKIFKKLHINVRFIK